MKLAVLAILISVTVSCKDKVEYMEMPESPQTTEIRKDSSRIYKIYLNEKNEILLNDSIVPLSDLEEHLNTLKENHGMVYYSRANYLDPAPEMSMKIMVLIAKVNVPVEFYTDKDFISVVSMQPGN